MRLDIADLEPAAVLDADLCVIGGGPAGLGLARELIDSPHDVILLESGGQTLEGETQKLYSGVVSGTLLDAWPGYLAMSRLRYLGGSSNHWQGWCRRHDPIDYEVRDWVPESGWPLELAQLAPFYERAARLCRIPQFDDERDRAHLHALLLGEESDFETSFLHISPPVRFGESYAPELAAARNVRLITHANVVRLEADESGRRVVSVEAMSLDGRRLTIRPRALVLACGGIENARLLLASARESGGGFGNNRDLVGRYFMEHPSVHFGYVVIPYWRWLMRSYSSLGFGGHKQFIRAVLRPSEALQRREHLLNSIFIFDHVDLAEAPALWAEISALATDVLQIAEGHANPKPGTNYLGTFRAEVEQIPDRENRVTLAETRDALEMPRASLRWTLDDRSEASLRATVDALVRALGVTLHARVQLLTDGSALWERSWPSNHHMGTTRMASSPDRGVVDADCRVHGMDNLWIAGSSVFPTSGCSNPTLTLIALALRLADHLRERLS